MINLLFSIVPLDSLSQSGLINDVSPLPTNVPQPTVNDPCLNVQEIIDSCYIVWVKVNIHLYVNDACEGNLAMSSGVTYDTKIENAYKIAEDIINKSNSFALNISDNVPWQNETINLPPKAQSYPLRFLLNGVHVHCNSDGLTDDLNWYNQTINQSNEINIFVTQTTSANGWTNFQGNFLVTNGLTGAIIPHEVLHIGNVHHTWEEYGEYQLADTWQNSVNWDHDCNPSTPNYVGSINCWSPSDESLCPIATCPLNIDHPCCGWSRQTTNLMSGSAYAENGNYSTVTHDQIERLLNTFNTYFCDKIMAVNPPCPPASSVIGILPIEGSGDDCSYCINFGASMNESQNMFEFFHHGLTGQTLLNSSKWINGQATSYCINLASIKTSNSGIYNGGFKAGNTYTIKLKTKDSCGNVVESIKTFTLPPVKNCGNIKGPIGGILSPNPGSNNTTLVLDIESPSTIVTYAVNPYIGLISNSYQNLGLNTIGQLSINFDTSLWPTGVNVINVVADNVITGFTFIKE